MDVKETPIEVGQVWRTGVGCAERTITRIIAPDGVVFDHQTTRTFETLREHGTLVQHADGFKPWAGGERPTLGEIDIRTRSGEYLATNAALVNWSATAVDPIVAYRVVEKRPVGDHVLSPTRYAELTLAEEVLVDLGWTFSANCWVAPHPDPLKYEMSFKAFHRLLCGRFGYRHDDKDWRRDQASLIEHIAGNKPDIHGLDVNDPEYGTLAAVLNRAHMQASGGKGKERHANGLPFEEQPMASINKALGSVDGFIYQAHKKSLEAKRLPDGRAQAELLGAINYLAGAVIALDSWAKVEVAA